MSRVAIQEPVSCLVRLHSLSFTVSPLTTPPLQDVNNNCYISLLSLWSCLTVIDSWVALDSSYSSRATGSGMDLNWIDLVNWIHSYHHQPSIEMPPPTDRQVEWLRSATRNLCNSVTRRPVQMMQQKRAMPRSQIGICEPTTDWSNGCLVGLHLWHWCHFTSQRSRYDISQLLLLLKLPWMKWIIIK